MSKITIRVPAVPVAQPRARATAVKGRARVYQPKGGTIAAFKASVRYGAAQAFSGAPLDGPLRVDSVFVFPRTVAQMRGRKPKPRLRHWKKPDRDNLDKAVMDALTGIVWRDDAQVCDGRLEKWIAAGDEQPHVLITITRLDDGVLADDGAALRTATASDCDGKKGKREKGQGKRQTSKR